MNIIHLYNKWCQGSAIDRVIAPPHCHLNEILFPSKIKMDGLMEDFFLEFGNWCTAVYSLSEVVTLLLQAGLVRAHGQQLGLSLLQAAGELINHLEEAHQEGGCFGPLEKLTQRQPQSCSNSHYSQGSSTVSLSYHKTFT